MTLIEQLIKLFTERLTYVGRIKTVDLIQLQEEFTLIEQLAEPIILQELNQKYRQQLQTLFNTGVVKQQGDNFGGLSKEQFDFIQQIDGKQILRSFSAYTQDYSNQLIKGLFIGEDYKKLSERISKEISAPPNWVIAQIDATTDQSQAVITAKIFEDEPQQKFLLTGPLDDKTRCQCKAVLMNQPKEGLTIAQIKAGAWTEIALKFCPKFKTDKSTNGQYTWTFRGGFNCRHYAEPAEATE